MNNIESLTRYLKKQARDMKNDEITHNEIEEYEEAMSNLYDILLNNIILPEDEVKIYKYNHSEKAILIDNNINEEGWYIVDEGQYLVNKRLYTIKFSEFQLNEGFTIKGVTTRCGITLGASR